MSYGEEKSSTAKWVSIGVGVLVAVIILWMAIMPRYRVWSQQMRGKAAFAEAEQNRRIQIEEAQANYESQILNSKAEVERARGMAKAIEIEQGKLTDRYIQYLWVRSIDGNEKIYIPTEANLPILEMKK